MTLPLTTSRPFVPGTTGWCADDLNDPEIERHWERGAYEIVEGVLTTMPPAYFDGSVALQNLTNRLQEHLRLSQQKGSFAPEVDLVLGTRRIARVDAVWMSERDLELQRAANAAHGKKTLQYGRLLVPPTLIIESVSIGHEDHDRETKRQWYAEFGVPNYLLLDAYDRKLEWLALDGPRYVLDCSGGNDDQLRPRAFPGLVINLRDVWSS